MSPPNVKINKKLYRIRFRNRIVFSLPKRLKESKQIYGVSKYYTETDKLHVIQGVSDSVVHKGSALWCVSSTVVKILVHFMRLLHHSYICCLLLHFVFFAEKLFTRGELCFMKRAHSAQLEGNVRGLFSYAKCIFGKKIQVEALELVSLYNTSKFTRKHPTQTLNRTEFE